MNRKNLIRKSLVAAAAGSIAPKMNAKENLKPKSTYDRLMNQVGLNH